MSIRSAIAILMLALAAGPAGAVTPAFKHALDPKSLGLTAEAVTFSSADSAQNLSGWWFAPVADKPTVVIAGRGSGTMADMLPAVREFQRQGFGVLTFDYRGFGPGGHAADSLQTAVFASMWVEDMVGALRYARVRSGPNRHVFAWGQDLGSAVALAAAARDRRNCTALAIEGVFRSSLDALRYNGTSTQFEVVRQHRWMVNGYDEPTSAAAILSVPMFVVLAGKDDVTPNDPTREVAGRSRSKVFYWPIAEAGHGDADKTPGYFDKVGEWFMRWTGYPVTR
jgi:hypothetical protein